ncbi:hypothetical protein [Micromonospora sp. NPDC047187]|uniref:hypothetical protein n=1 Tax=Micromonospora sp. NPDC047187 TaxID=3155262 RepID=UPI0033FDCAD3
MTTSVIGIRQPFLGLASHCCHLVDHTYRQAITAAGTGCAGTGCAGTGCAAALDAGRHLATMS